MRTAHSTTPTMKPTMKRMMPPTMLRLSLPSLLALAALTACGDAPNASAAGSTPAATVHASTISVAGDTTVQTFTVAPGWNDRYVIDGVHAVELEAGAVCDPATTAYGPAEWDAPCTPITRPLTFTAKSWTDAQGHPRVTFSPDVRFAPGTTNTITLKDKSAAAELAGARIRWCPTGSTVCVDEAAADPTLTTVRNTNGTLSRRVKHFSGYTVTAD